MESNTSVWKRYQPGFVDEDFVPYLRENVVSNDGHIVSINKWKKQKCVGTMLEPALIRKNKGLTFQRMFDSDPCPNGFVRGPDGYCMREPLKHEPIFYTDKAFIAKRQFWDGYGINPQGHRRISEQTDLRSVNPITGQYTIYYNPLERNVEQRYAHPVPDTRYQYDQSWYLPPKRNYMLSPTSDSYLG